MGVEVLRLGPYDEERRQREFDATNGDGGWEGLVRYDDHWDPPRIYVAVDRRDPHGDSYACRPGQLEEIIDDETATALIVRALTGMPYRPIGYWTASGFTPIE